MTERVRCGRVSGQVIRVLSLAIALVGWCVSPVGASVSGSPASPGVAVEPWEVQHRNGFAGGTYEIVPSGFFFKTITVEGELGSSVPGECYEAQLMVNHDLTVWFYDVATHCGTGSTPLVTSASGSIATTSFGIRLCQVVGGAVRDCGPVTRLP